MARNPHAPRNPGSWTRERLGRADLAIGAALSAVGAVIGIWFVVAEVLG